MQLADQGRGGGLLGAAMLSMLLETLGAAGTVVVLASWLLAGVMLFAGWSVAEVVGYGDRILRRVRRLPQARTSDGRVPEATFTPMPAVRPARPVGPGSSGVGAVPAPAGTTPIEAAVETEPAPPAHEWLLPEIAEILEPGVEGKADEEFSRQRARMIEETLAAFGAPAHVVEVNRGPTITQFGVEPGFVDARGGKRPTVKVSKIAALADDLALALAAPSIRIEAPVPGKGFVGIEVPNAEIVAGRRCAT